LYHNIELDLAEAFLETDQQISEGLDSTKVKRKAEDKLKSLKKKLGSLNENIDKEYKMVQDYKLDSTSKEVTKIIQLINSVVALIPEVVALEKKIGTLKS